MPLALRALLLLLLACQVCPAAALESAPAVSPRATASLVSDVDSVAAGRPFRIGLRLRLAPGWHTYWQNPGDAGVPPDLDLDLPPGATAGPIDWPVPERVAEGALMTYAYTGDVLLPVTVTPVGRFRRHDRQGARELAGLPRHLRTGGGRLPARPARRRRPALGAGAIVRRVRPAGAATLAVACGGRRRRDAVRAGARADAGHRGRCLVHPGRRRRDPRQRGPAADGLAGRLHPRAAARQGVPPGGRPVRHPVDPRPHRAGDRRGAARRRGQRAAAAARHGAAARAGAGLPRRADPQPDAVRVPGAGAEGRRPGRRGGAARRAGRPPPTPPACWWRSPGWARRCWRRARPAPRRAGGSSSSRRCSSPP